MFENKEEYIEAKAECKAKITKVIKVWSAEEETIHDVAFQEGAKLGFQLCAKSRLNITSISDCPIKEDDKLQWHDLEKDPNDLPKDYKTMCICLGGFGSQYQPVPRVCVGYYDSLGWSDYMGSSLYSTVRYWCELPKFKE